MIESLQEILLQAGELALEYFAQLENLTLTKKDNPKDIVTQADVEVEKFLQRKLSALNPDYGFWGEEAGQSGQTVSRWVVDPIDGTHSFVRGQYFWGISVALEVDSELELAGIYAPALDDLYLAERNKGAQKNGKSIRVSETRKLEEAMVATGFACLRADLKENNLSRFNRIAEVTMGQRRFGSAALDLCLVADGQLDAFWEQHLNYYDVAAGCLIALEAGGTITDFKGNATTDPENILATNRWMLPLLLPLMEDNK